jgi:hypothetical protein
LRSTEIALGLAEVNLYQTVCCGGNPLQLVKRGSPNSVDVPARFPESVYGSGSGIVVALSKRSLSGGDANDAPGSANAMIPFIATTDRRRDSIPLRIGTSFNARPGFA